jgi:UDP-glucuronate decarboxylase
MNCLVLGGAGFLGSHLVDRLLTEGHAVTVVDTMRDCHPDNLDAARAAAGARLVVIPADAADASLEIPGRFDEAYHLAGVVATREFVARPVEALLTSLLPMQRLLQHKRAHQPELRLLFASSSEVYGDARTPLQHEDDRGNVSCQGPRSGYDEGKRATESLIVGYRRQYGLERPCAIVRLFNTYGPRMTANGRLVPSMIRMALTHGEIMVNAPGTQTRTLQYVSDCIEAMRRAIRLQPEVPINVGGAAACAVAEIARQIAAAVTRRTGRTIRIVPGPMMPDEVMQRQPDVERARELLEGWRATVGLAEGVEATIDYWRDRT